MTFSKCMFCSNFSIFFIIKSSPNWCLPGPCPASSPFASWTLPRVPSSLWRRETDVPRWQLCPSDPLLLLGNNYPLSLFSPNMFIHLCGQGWLKAAKNHSGKLGRGQLCPAGAFPPRPSAQVCPHTHCPKTWHSLLVLEWGLLLSGCIIS